jgi:nucleotide-binding universal stress UspA family protein
VGDAAGPILLCYDASEGARWAIERAAAALPQGQAAVALTVWESLGSPVLRHPAPAPERLRAAAEMARDINEVAGEVVEALDAEVRAAAEATAREGAELAGQAGFAARPVARRALGTWGERTETTVWQAILAQGEEDGASLVVLGRRGRSEVVSALLGSVSYGVVHHARRPVLVVPPRDEP